MSASWSGNRTSPLRYPTVEQAFGRTTLWTWDRRRGGKLRVVRLWFGHVMDDSGADKTNGITVILFICDCCQFFKRQFPHLHSVIMACRLWVNGIAVSVIAASLFVLSTVVMSG
jgi:hypothetical protein